MSTLKKLAGQTALYGLSSILGRVLNYLLVPLHTKIFDPAQFGAVTELYAYVAFFNVIYTYGMETTFFRFATKQLDSKNEIYQQAFSTVLISSLIFSLILIGLATPITTLLNYHNKEQYIYFLAIILFIDAATAIPFAKLRLENKVLLFVGTKLMVILVTMTLNFLFLLFVSADIKYVFLANLLANALIPVILVKEILPIKVYFNWNFLKPMLLYGLPIMVMGLAGMVNEVLDRIMLRYLLKESTLDGLTKIEAIGVYGACYKLSIFMTLVVQAFRYAAEPFFFSKAKDKDSKELYASVLNYFVIACCVILIGVTANLSWIKFFLMNKLYWKGLIIVPILLLANLFLGIYNNLSIWFKLTDKTYMGTFITFTGAFVTIGFNIILIPTIGYLGSAITTLICYFSMAILCYLFGQRFFPVPYKIPSLTLYIMAAIGLTWLAYHDWIGNFWLNLFLKNAYLIVYLGVIGYLERNEFSRIIKGFKV